MISLFPPPPFTDRKITGIVKLSKSETIERGSLSNQTLNIFVLYCN